VEKKNSVVADLLLAAGMVAGLAWLLSNQKPRQSISTAKNDAETASNLKPKTLSAVSINHGWHPEESEHRSEERSFWRRQARNSKWTLIFSAVAVLIALGAALIANWAYHETRRQADAAEKQIEVARDGIQRQLRAYITVSFKDFTYYKPERRVIIRYAMSNGGETPAYKVRNVSDIKVFPYPLENGFVLETPAHPAGEAKITINPKTESYGSKEFVFYGDVESLQRGFRPYMWGIVHYLDIFGSERYTQFAFSLIDFDRYLLGTRDMSLRADFVNQHNDSN
jgi:hypothetical protein